MKNILVIVMISGLLALGCAGEEAGREGLPDGCVTPPQLVIKNDSIYVLESLYVHDVRPDYTSNSAYKVADGVIQNTEVTSVKVADGDAKYFTFIRKLTTTSEYFIAVTSADTVGFTRCYEYTLHVLEEDFFLDIEENF